MISFNSEQIIIVTGATSGIGKAVCLLLNKLGARVIAIGRNPEKLENLKNEVENKAIFHTEIRDLSTDHDTLPDFMKFLKEKYGKFYGLAYCAGVEEATILRNLSVEAINRVYAVNYIAPLMMIKGFADKRNNVGEGASIVCISSIAADNTEKGQIIYGGSKSALNASLRAIYKELLPQKIRVNVVSPAPVNTPMLQDNVNKERILNMCKMGVIEPEEVANVVSFLLSSLSLKLTGGGYTISGGYSFEE